MLDNLIFAKVEGNRQWSIGRLDPNWRLVEPRRVDTVRVMELAQRVSLSGRGWSGVRLAASGGATDALLGSLLAGAGGVPAVGVGVPAVGVGGSPPNSALGTGNGTGTEQGTPIAVLRVLRASGMTREKARDIGCKFRDLDWTEAGKPESVSS